MSNGDKTYSASDANGQHATPTASTPRILHPAFISLVKALARQQAQADFAAEKDSG